MHKRSADQDDRNQRLVRRNGSVTVCEEQQLLHMYTLLLKSVNTAHGSREVIGREASRDVRREVLVFCVERKNVVPSSL